MAACSSTSSSNLAAATADASTTSTLSVAPNPAIVSKGNSTQLTAVATLADGTKRDVTTDPATIWASDNTQTATVDAEGLVVGVSIGVTSVGASFGGATSAVAVTVTP